MTNKGKYIRIKIKPDEIMRWNPTAAERWKFITNLYRAHKDYLQRGKRKRAARGAFDQTIRKVLK